MLAGSVTSSASSERLSICSRVFANRSAYSASGNAGMVNLLLSWRCRSATEQQSGIDVPGGLDLCQFQELVRPVRRLDVSRSEEQGRYPGPNGEEAGVAGRPPGADPRLDAHLAQSQGQRAHQGMALLELEGKVLPAEVRLDHEPGQARADLRDHVLQLGANGLGRLARVDPAVDLYDTAVGDHVRPGAAVDRPHREVGRGKRRVRILSPA